MPYDAAKQYKTHKTPYKSLFSYGDTTERILSQESAASSAQRTECRKSKNSYTHSHPRINPERPELECKYEYTVFYLFLAALEKQCFACLFILCVIQVKKAPI